MSFKVKTCQNLVQCKEVTVRLTLATIFFFRYPRAPSSIGFKKKEKKTRQNKNKNKTKLAINAKKYQFCRL